jgi:hypothetical protein
LAARIVVYVNGDRFQSRGFLREGVQEGVVLSGWLVGWLAQTSSIDYVLFLRLNAIPLSEKEGKGKITYDSRS